MLCLFPIFVGMHLWLQGETAPATVPAPGASKPASSLSTTKEDVGLVHVIASGMAPLGIDGAAAEEEAIWDAKRNAVEMATGVFIRARTFGENYRTLHDEVENQTAGFIRSWRLVPESVHVESIAPGPNGRLLCLQIEADVAKLSTIQSLGDIRDAYNDLGNPRLLVKIACPTAPDCAQVAQQELELRLRSAGYDLAETLPADIVLRGQLQLVPAVRLGDAQSPYHVGDVVAVYQAHLTLEAVSPWSLETLFVAQAEAKGVSFQSDALAAEQAAQNAVDTLMQQSRTLFTQEIPARWAKERMDGHPVALRVIGLAGAKESRLCEALEGMRGFCDILRRQHQAGSYDIIFRSCLATQDVALRLGQIPGLPLKLVSMQGASLVYQVPREAPSSAVRGPYSLRKGVSFHAKRTLSALYFARRPARGAGGSLRRLTARR
ncbi:hypothetical protein CTKA_02654 [Chthonomonas calidirosea]|uniref:Flagellar assembly protein T N-terminal domain-containing protein n=1 Tax=Chthonomonas calidirosea (strain DSM 23976 / ICMP 18418 / T49) TaxID=1303518 RepID=S0EYW6_CHTCT|nr:hypothetical protein [Chthonomonas calidirosea]CCW35261.1 hypothetical protein CCALI_01445 [Chthonomonas calidirosea T49]CEK20722.1 hypothetical protein CTKA_02654 [Chthonomonas calidirosea]